MHGQLKVKIPLSEEEKKKKEKEAKVKLYKSRMEQIFDKRKNELHDQETLNIIDEVLSGNPDIYTLWNYRREILLSFLSLWNEEELAALLKTELKFTETCFRVNPKSYCVWHHREWVLNNFPNPNFERELELCTLYLKLDERNFHCWDYRRMVALKLNITAEKELEYTTEKINENFSNYSSWHYRSKLLPQVSPDPAGIRPIEEKVHLNELELVVNAAFTDPNDQSAWFYQRWLLGRTEPKPKLVRALYTHKKLFLAFSAGVSPNDVSVSCGYQLKSVSPFLMMCEVENPNECFTVTCDKDLPIDVNLKKCDNGGNLYWSSGDGPDPLQSGFSQALRTVIADQLTTCNQLLELEPTSKWTLLTSTHMMLAIDRKHYKDEIMKRLTLLKEIDVMREVYYSDLMSRYQIEYKLEEGDQSEFRLTGCFLHSLYHMQYLLLIDFVDLSNNSLNDSALPSFLHFQACQTLKLDGNNITSLKMLHSLPNLEVLSLENNKITSPDCIVPFLSKFPSLKKINLRNNPITLNKESNFSNINEVLFEIL